MKKTLLAFLVVTLFTACISTKNYNAIVEPKFKEITTITTSENFIFDLSPLENKNSSATSKRVSSKFIPAIFFWKWEKTILCEINPFVVGQSFQDNFLKYADTLNVAKKIEGKKLAIKVEQIPNSFEYTYSVNALMLVIAFSYSETQVILPQRQNLVVSYKLSQDGTSSKEGKLIVMDRSKPLTHSSKSTQKFTGIYIDQFKQNGKEMTKELVEKLLAEI